MTARRGLFPVAVLLLSLAVMVPAERWLESASSGSSIEEEVLYLSTGSSVKTLALGYDAVLADIYWMRAIQYFGGKVLGDASILNEQGDRLPLLYPLVDISTTLDPQLIPAYRFGSFFIHDYGQPQQAYELLEKGIRNNPENPWLYQDLAFALWKDGDCVRASKVYAEGARQPNAPAWMESMSATVLADCGHRSLAVQMLESMYKSTEDVRIREDIERQLKVYQAIAELELLNFAVSYYTERIGSRPQSLAQVVRTVVPPAQPGIPKLTLDRSGTPLDPNGMPYVYYPETGVVTANPSSIRLPKSAMPEAPK